MKKISLFFIALLCGMSAVFAQDSFEGQIMFKVMNSYSSKFIKAAPYLFSGADTCVVDIKGDKVHMYYKTLGIHKVITDERIYYWSENTLAGFDMPLFVGSNNKYEWTPTNSTKHFGDISASLFKNKAVYEYYVREGECWIADSHPYTFAEKALSRMYSFLIFSNLGGDNLDYKNKLCLKATSHMIVSAQSERAIGMYGNSLGHMDKSQADNAATNECSASNSFELVSIKEGTINDDVFVAASNVKFISQADVPTIKEYILLLAELYPSMNLNMKGSMGDQVMNMIVENMESYFNTLVEQRGVSREDVLSQEYYSLRENIILSNNKEFLKKKKKIKEGKSNKNSEAVIYDINEEWDF